MKLIDILLFQEAMHLMQEMWGQGSSSEKPGFQIFQEPTPKENTKPKFQIFEEPKPVETNTASKAKFQVFQEPVTKNISSAKKVPPKPKFEIYVKGLHKVFFLKNFIVFFHNFSPFPSFLS